MTAYTGSKFDADSQLKVGTAIKEHKDWGRTGGIILGIIQLFGFPIGTIIGTYILWCLTKGWDE